jgi:hypothetical protein
MRPRRLVVIGLSVAAIWIGYRSLVPDDDAQIRDVLDRIAAAASDGDAADSEVSRLARAASVRGELDPDVTVDAGPPFQPMKGRDAIVGTIARVRGTVSDLDLAFDDVEITIDPVRTTARVYLTAEARYRDGSGARVFDARELDVTFRRLDGGWVVSQVALVRTLDPLTPR